MARLKMLNDFNQAPTANNDEFTIADTAAVRLTMRANDSDPNEDYIYSEFISAQVGSVIEMENEDIVYTPQLHFNGTDTLYYLAHDLGGLYSDTAMILVHVTPSGIFPILQSDTMEIYSGETDIVDISINDDYQGEVCEFNVLTQPTQGTCYLNPSGVMRYFSDAAPFEGKDSIEYQVCKSYGYCASNWLYIDVSLEPTAPITQNDNISVSEENTLVQPLLNDVDPNGRDLTLSILQGPFHADAQVTPIADNEFTYQNPSFVSFESDSVEYQICNSDQLCDQAWVMLTSAYVGIEENEINQLSVYPNPTNGQVTIQTEGEIKNIECYDVQGQKIQINRTESMVNLSLLSDGVYFLKVYFEKGSSFVRVVKK